MEIQKVYVRYEIDRGGWDTFVNFSSATSVSSNMKDRLTCSNTMFFNLKKAIFSTNNIYIKVFWSEYIPYLDTVRHVRATRALWYLRDKTCKKQATMNQKYLLHLIIEFILLVLTELNRL